MCSRQRSWFHADQPLIRGDEKLLLALLQWSRPFPVIATSMHREATACGGEIAGTSHAEQRKGTRAVGFDEWWIARTSAHFHLGQLSDREKCFSLGKKCFSTRSRQVLLYRVGFWKRHSYKDRCNIWKSFFGYQVVEVLWPSVNQRSVLAWNVGDLDKCSEQRRMLLTIQLTSDFQIIYLVPSSAPMVNVIVLLYNKLHISITGLCFYHMSALGDSGIIPLGLIPYLLAVQLGFSDIDSSWFYWVAGKEI